MPYNGTTEKQMKIAAKNNGMKINVTARLIATKRELGGQKSKVINHQEPNSRRTSRLTTSDKKPLE